MHFQKKSACVSMHVYRCTLVILCAGAPPSTPLTKSCLPSCAPNFPRDLNHSSRKMTVGPRRVRTVITCDITTLISSLVIVKSLWVEQLNNGEECKMRGGVCVVVWMRPTVVSGRCSLLLHKFLHCNFACRGIGLDNQRPSSANMFLNRFKELIWQ